MGSYLVVPLLMAVTIRRSPQICGLATLAALLAVYTISISGRGSSGPLDVVNGNSFYPLLRAVAGFTLGLAIFRFAGVLDRLSMTAQDEHPSRLEKMKQEVRRLRALSPGDRMAVTVFAGGVAW